MKWDLQICQVCDAPKKTLYAVKDDPQRIKMCKQCYNKKIKDQNK